MSAAKPEKVASKLATWERVRELDRRAFELIRAGVSMPEAYRIAVRERQ